MPKLQSLSNSRVNRKVREVIENGEETIFVYEPSVDDVEKIVEMQDVMSEEFEGAPLEVVISGEDVVRKIFPILTNIEGIEELSDEEIEYIISNPSIALLQVQHVVETIITQIYKTVILSAKKRILEADFDAASLAALDGVLSQVAGLEAKNNEKALEVYNNFNATADNVISLIDRANNEEDLGEESESEETHLEEEAVDESAEAVAEKTTQNASAIDKYMDKLDNYLDTFDTK